MKWDMSWVALIWMNEDLKNFCKFLYGKQEGLYLTICEQADLKIQIPLMSHQPWYSCHEQFTYLVTWQFNLFLIKTTGAQEWGAPL